MPDPTPPSPRAALRRNAARGRYDRATVDAILDATPLCHLSFVVDGHPMLIPTLQARIDDHVYVHSSTGSRVAVAAAAGGVPVTLGVTLVDGYVLARSAFHHSVNYRSVLVMGDAELVQDPDERLAALRATTEAVAPGRWDELRKPTSRELAATAVLRIGLEEAAAKVRSGPPIDDPADLHPSVWAGVLPVRTIADDPVPAPDVDDDVATPASVIELRRRLR